MMNRPNMGVRAPMMVENQPQVAPQNPAAAPYRGPGPESHLVQPPAPYRGGVPARAMPCGGPMSPVNRAGPRKFGSF